MAFAISHAMKRALPGFFDCDRQNIAFSGFPCQGDSDIRILGKDELHPYTSIHGTTEIQLCRECGFQIATAADAW